MTTPPPDIREKIRQVTSAEDRPPVFRTWPRLYAAVLLHLLFWIVVFYLFTVRFNLPT